MSDSLIALLHNTETHPEIFGNSLFCNFSFSILKDFSAGVFRAGTQKDMIVNFEEYFSVVNKHVWMVWVGVI